MAFTSGPLYLNVLDPAFGAVGDGVVDDTNAIQTAISTALMIRSSGAQNVVVVSFPPAMYRCTGTLDLSLPIGSDLHSTPIVLSGSSQGPYRLFSNDNPGFDIPLFSIETETLGTPFIRIGNLEQGFQQANIRIEDLHFHYPANTPRFNPKGVPVLFPPTINIVGTDVTIRRCSTDNTTQFIQAGFDSEAGEAAQTGRLVFEDLVIGALQSGISVDCAVDFVRCRNVQFFPGYGVTTKTIQNPYFNFALENMIGFQFGGVDGVVIEDSSVFGAKIGLLADASLNPSLGPSASYGQVANFGTDTVGIGFWIKESQAQGWTFSSYISNGNDTQQGSLPVESQWAGFVGDSSVSPAKVGFAQVIGGALSGTFTQSQTLQPYGVISTNSFTGPFGQSPGGSNLRPVWIVGYND